MPHLRKAFANKTIDIANKGMIVEVVEPTDDQTNILNPRIITKLAF